jgi:tetratricopeptide (TPR) repeat protein
VRSRLATLAAAAIGASLACSSPPATSHDVTSGLAALNQLCRSTIDRADYEEAQRICKRINFDAEKMAPASQEHITSLLNMGDIKARVENFVDADAYYTSALRLVERNGGAQGEDAARILTNLIEFKVRRGKYLDAVGLAKRVLAIREHSAGAQSASVAIARARYADLLSQSHQFPEAEAEYLRAIGVLEASAPETAEAHARAVQRLGEMYERRARYPQAEQQYRRLVVIAERHALSYRLLAGALDRLGYVCEQQDRPLEAAAFYRRALSTLNGTLAAPEVIARIQAQLAALNPQAAPPDSRPMHGTR